MSFDLIPKNFWNFHVPSRMSSMLDDMDEWTNYLPSSGLTVSEDAHNVYIEAQVPGVDPNLVDISVSKGVLWIKAHQEQSEQDKHRKFYKKASTSFSYHITLPQSVDHASEPDASIKHGIAKIIIKKSSEEQPKKLKVKVE